MTRLFALVWVAAAILAGYSAQAASTVTSNSQPAHAATPSNVRNNLMTHMSGPRPALNMCLKHNDGSYCGGPNSLTKFACVNGVVKSSEVCSPLCKDGNCDSGGTIAGLGEGGAK